MSLEYFCKAMEVRGLNAQQKLVLLALGDLAGTDGATGVMSIPDAVKISEKLGIPIEETQQALSFLKENKVPLPRPQ